MYGELSTHTPETTESQTSERHVDWEHHLVIVPALVRWSTTHHLGSSRSQHLDAGPTRISLALKPYYAWLESRRSKAKRILACCRPLLCTTPRTARHCRSYVALVRGPAERPVRSLKTAASGSGTRLLCQFPSNASRTEGSLRLSCHSNHLVTPFSFEYPSELLGGTKISTFTYPPGVLPPSFGCVFSIASDIRKARRCGTPSACSSACGRLVSIHARVSANSAFVPLP
ncbi:hypothetical protein SCHPADRAFT_694379 [Schizopora paradoxa]|uniref:Uncharacterized protein n=1 Tax=Schizopora paradoxa TaxID=27342 RepID=A0A0H2RN50_9AGAM|nr:hypothetical protein SCHPADRAFT_694379 [Schizopora paradoxa]